MIGGEASLQSQKVKICFYAHHFSWLLRFDEATTFFCERFRVGGKIKTSCWFASQNSYLYEAAFVWLPERFRKEYSQVQHHVFEGSSFSQKSCVLKAWILPVVVDITKHSSAWPKIWWWKLFARKRPIRLLGMKAKHFHLDNEFVVEILCFTFPASWKHIGTGGLRQKVVKACFP